MSEKHPLDFPALEIAQGIKDGKFTSEEVVKESLRRAEFITKQLNSFTVLRNEQALRAAKHADELARQGSTLPLLGVPFAAKDLTPTKGDLTTLGSWTTGDWVPTETALIVQRLQEAGAILIGKTTTPEFAHSSLTASPRWGKTRNPWDPDKSPGGSSGGSAVAVATGVVPFAEGSDMGGSVRIPSSFSGIVGLKPSLGRIPMTILPSVLDNISHFGPLARSVQDAVTFLKYTSGPDDSDISSLPLTFDTSRSSPTTLKGKRFAFSMDLGYYHVQPETQEVLLKVIEKLKGFGAIVEEVKIPWTREVADKWYQMWGVFMAAYFGDFLPNYRSDMDPIIVELIEDGSKMSAKDYKQIEIMRTNMWKQLYPILQSYDALLCPTCAQTAPSIDEDDLDFVEDLPDGSYHGLDMTCPFNLVAQCPALSLPVDLASNGLPVGLQIVGDRFKDEEVLSIAATIEKAISSVGMGVPVGWKAPKGVQW